MQIDETSSSSALSTAVASRHLWQVDTWNETPVTKELSVKFYLILIKMNLNFKRKAV